MFVSVSHFATGFSLANHGTRPTITSGDQNRWSKHKENKDVLNKLLFAQKREPQKQGAEIEVKAKMEYNKEKRKCFQQTTACKAINFIKIIYVI